MSSPGARRRRTRALLGVAAAVAALAATSGWIAIDVLEQDNDFCNACHLTPDVPLHIDLRRDFDALVAASLAGAHGQAPVERRSGVAAWVDGASFRCIDCHGGHGLLGSVRVRALAAKDAFWYVVGHFEEPEEMRWPLWDEDCARCHRSFDESEVPPWRTPRFHQLAVHNVELGVACVECHLTHEVAGDPKVNFLYPRWVRTQCARCHLEFEEEEG